MVAGFKMLRALTDDVKLIAEVMRSSKQVELDETLTMIRPQNFSVKRSTIKLRDIPSTTPEQDISRLFDSDKFAKPKSIKSDIGGTWFITFDQESDALAALDFIRSQKFNDKPIQAGIKSENILKSM